MTNEEIITVAKDEAAKLSPKARPFIDGRLLRPNISLLYPDDQHGVSVRIDPGSEESVRQGVRDCYETLRLQERLRDPSTVAVEQRPSGYTKYRDNEGEFWSMSVS
jgi:hypothetical protein